MKWNNLESKWQPFTNNVYKLWSYLTVKVAVVLVLAAYDMVLPWLSEAEDALQEDEPLVSLSTPFLSALILRSIKSEINPGFVILLSSMSISPVSILTTEDIGGRSLDVSWVQRSPTFRNVQASSASKCPSKDASTSPTSSFRW